MTCRGDAAATDWLLFGGGRASVRFRPPFFVPRAPGREQQKGRGPWRSLGQDGRRGADRAAVRTERERCVPCGASVSEVGGSGVDEVRVGVTGGSGVDEVRVGVTGGSSSGGGEVRVEVTGGGNEVSEVRVGVAGCGSSGAGAARIGEARIGAARVGEARIGDAVD